MAKGTERDSLSGVETTGHEWDGIRELDNPMPLWWLWVFYATILFSIVWWILYPAWPSSTGYTRGLLGSNQRLELDARLAEARAAQAVFIDRIAAASPAEIIDEPDLLQFAVAGGARHFKDNCAGCHGLGGGGQLHYPSLADDSWIWGGTLDEILYTINHGIRNEDDADARFALMPSFGIDGMLAADEIQDVTHFVLSLGGREHDAERAARGDEIYAMQCVSCHGEGGEGILELGGPALNDAVWLYGEEPAAIAAQINNPRHGVMPAWQGRLPDEIIKMLTVYVHNLGGGQ